MPFGPDRGGAPITVTISPFHGDGIKRTEITRFPLVEGELRTRFADKFTVVSETVQQAAAVETDCADANTKTLANTVALIRELLSTAYREGPDAAALRKWVAIPSNDPEDKGAFTIREVADRVRAGKELDGDNIYDEIGVSSIGGPALFAASPGQFKKSPRAHRRRHPHNLAIPLIKHIQMRIKSQMAVRHDQARRRRHRQHRPGDKPRHPTPFRHPITTDVFRVVGPRV